MSNVEEQNAAWEREQMAALDAELGPHVVTVQGVDYDLTDGAGSFSHKAFTQLYLQPQCKGEIQQLKQSPQWKAAYRQKNIKKNVERNGQPPIIDHGQTVRSLYAHVVVQSTEEIAALARLSRNDLIMTDPGPDDESRHKISRTNIFEPKKYHVAARTETNRITNNTSAERVTVHTDRHHSMHAPRTRDNTVHFASDVSTLPDTTNTTRHTAHNHTHSHSHNSSDVERRLQFPSIHSRYLPTYMPNLRSHSHHPSPSLRNGHSHARSREKMKKWSTVNSTPKKRRKKKKKNLHTNAKKSTRNNTTKLDTALLGGPPTSTKSIMALSSKKHRKPDLDSVNFQPKRRSKCAILQVKAKKHRQQKQKSNKRTHREKHHNSLQSKNKGGTRHSSGPSRNSKAGTTTLTANTDKNSRSHIHSHNYNHSNAPVGRYLETAVVRTSKGKYVEVGGASILTKTMREKYGAAMTSAIVDERRYTLARRRLMEKQQTQKRQQKLKHRQYRKFIDKLYPDEAYKVTQHRRKAYKEKQERKRETQKQAHELAEMNAQFFVVTTAANVHDLAHAASQPGAPIASTLFYHSKHRAENWKLHAEWGKKERAIVRIQRVVRGHLGRVRAQWRRSFNRRVESIITKHKWYCLMRWCYKCIDALQKWKNAMRRWRATQFQRVWRGHQGRVQCDARSRRLERNDSVLYWHRWRGLKRLNQRCFAIWVNKAQQKRRIKRFISQCMYGTRQRCFVALTQYLADLARWRARQVARCRASLDTKRLRLRVSAWHMYCASARQGNHREKRLRVTKWKKWCVVQKLYRTRERAAGKIQSIARVLFARHSVRDYRASLFIGALTGQRYFRGRIGRRRALLRRLVRTFIRRWHLWAKQIASRRVHHGRHRQHQKETMRAEMERERVLLAQRRANRALERWLLSREGEKELKTRAARFLVESQIDEIILDIQAHEQVKLDSEKGEKELIEKRRKRREKIKKMASAHRTKKETRKKEKEKDEEDRMDNIDKEKERDEQPKKEKALDKMNRQERQERIEQERKKELMGKEKAGLGRIDAHAPLCRGHRLPCIRRTASHRNRDKNTAAAGLKPTRKLATNDFRNFGQYRKDNNDNKNDITDPYNSIDGSAINNNTGERDFYTCRYSGQVVNMKRGHTEDKYEVGCGHFVWADKWEKTVRRRRRKQMSWLSIGKEKTEHAIDFAWGKHKKLKMRWIAYTMRQKQMLVDKGNRVFATALSHVSEVMHEKRVTMEIEEAKRQDLALQMAEDVLRWKVKHAARINALTAFRSERPSQRPQFECGDPICRQAFPTASELISHDCKFVGYCHSHDQDQGSQFYDGVACPGGGKGPAWTARMKVQAMAIDSFVIDLNDGDSRHANGTSIRTDHSNSKFTPGENL